MSSGRAGCKLQEPATLPLRPGRARRPAPTCAAPAGGEEGAALPGVRDRLLRLPRQPDGGPPAGRGVGLRPAHAAGSSSAACVFVCRMLEAQAVPRAGSMQSAPAAARAARPAGPTRGCFLPPPGTPCTAPTGSRTTWQRWSCSRACRGPRSGWSCLRPTCWSRGLLTRRSMAASAWGAPIHCHLGKV